MFGVESMENIAKLWKHIRQKLNKISGKILKIISRNITYKIFRESFRIYFGTCKKSYVKLLKIFCKNDRIYYNLGYARMLIIFIKYWR